MTSITDRINISAQIIRVRYTKNHSLARKAAQELFPDLSFIEQPFDTVSADKTWMGHSLEHPDTVCGAFYNEATERQATRVLNKAVRDFRE